MPSITIGPVPVRVSQAVAQAANLQNTGAATIYMDTNSAVSPLAYGVAMAPRSSVNWSSGNELWAVTDGAETQLSVLYGAEGTTVSEVSAVVTGDVTATIEGPIEAEITGPVTVNGTVNVGNVIQTETEITNTVTTTVSGTVDTVITAPVDITGDVDATITGPVSISGAVTVGGILTPVSVQGGGELLLIRNGNVAASGLDVFTIPAPPSGQTYYGLAFRFQMTSGADNATPMSVDVLNFGSSFEATSQSVMSSSSLGALELGRFGNRNTCQTIIPVGASFPIQVGVSNASPSTARNYTFVAIGISHADPIPRDGPWTNQYSTPDVSFASAAAGSFAIIASSKEDRLFQLNALSGTTQGSFVVEELNSNTGAWVVNQQRAQNSLYGGNTGNVALQSETTSFIRVPGTGNMHRVRNTNSVTGTIHLSYQGKVHG